MKHDELYRIVKQHQLKSITKEQSRGETRAKIEALRKEGK